ncbi:hypothetical protein GF369_00980 [Candidatus Peregrinibacteria bacterium]|nr:hypothetical protein [Candidatus Peregrinibacteria bacterium]
MRQPTLSQFKKQLEELIENAPSGKLKDLIYIIANETRTEQRNNFLEKAKLIISGEYKNQDKAEKEETELTADVLFDKIKKFRNRIEQGEFYDEERDYEAYHRNEYHYYRYDDYYEEPDYSDEECVLEMIELLDDAEHFYHSGIALVAFKAYQELFEIMESEQYQYDEYFIDGFSFKGAIENTIYNAHKIYFLRLFYHLNIDDNRNDVFNLYRQQRDIYLSAIVDADTTPLKDFDHFIDDYINYLSGFPKDSKHLIDSLFVKGGIDSLKKFAYEHGHRIPATFITYYIEQKERNISHDKLLKIINDGLEIIPEKYASRSILSNGLVEIAKTNNDTELLTKAYTTAFYSYPTLDNLDLYLGNISKNSNHKELQRFELYIKGHKEEFNKKDKWYTPFETVDAYSFASISISKIAYLVSDFILHGIENQLEFLDEEKFLGFQNENKYIPVIVALLFQTVAQSKEAKNIDALTNYYCFDTNNDKYENIKHLIYQKAKELSLNKLISTAIETAEKITVKRVQHILEEKIRGGYETSCLLLVACAEAKEIHDKSGNQLINRIDTKYKRFSAFRRELKVLTKKSMQLMTVS